MNNIEAIFAIDNNNGIAKNGNIPWDNKVDMKFFREKTLNNIVIMGSNTLLSLPKQSPLKNRLNIVLTKNINKYLNLYKKYDNIIFLYDISCNIFLLDPNKFIESNKFTFLKNNYKIYVIGGLQILNLLYKYCSVLWVTKYKINYNCDLFIDYDYKNYDMLVIYEDENLQICKYTLL
jgi:dihydrofolate reductase